MINLKTDGIVLSFDPEFGMIAGFVVSDQGQKVAPLHRAPWVGTGEEMPPDAAPHLAKLGGDFFCAPFGREVDGAPLHGWPANALWSVETCDVDHLQARLSQRVSGASLTKDISLRQGHPFVYQSHVFSGGEGLVPFANHANISLQDGGLIRTSHKAIWRTPGSPVEGDASRGRSGLVYPGESKMMAKFPSRDGVVDLGSYPWFEGCEDFVAGVEEGDATFGWTAVTRSTQGDLFLSLRRADRQPMTMLWHSNGGRDYAPWSGRHFGCLGVEEGAAGHLLGPGSPVPANAAGLVLRPDGKVEVRHVTGAIFWPSGEAVVQVDVSSQVLIVHGEKGAVREVALDTDFLEV